MSLQILFGYDYVVRQWVEERIKFCKFDKSAKAFGFVKDGKIIAGAVFSDYRPEYGDISFSFASDGETGWQSRKAMSMMYAYPFGQLKCRRVTAYVRQGNKRAIKMLTKHLNFKYEGCIREVFPDGKGAVIFGLLKRDIPAWAYRHGHEFP